MTKYNKKVTAKLMKPDWTSIRHPLDMILLFKFPAPPVNV